MPQSFKTLEEALSPVRLLSAKLKADATRPRDLKGKRDDRPKLKRPNFGSVLVVDAPFVLNRGGWIVFGCGVGTIGMAPRP